LRARGNERFNLLIQAYSLLSSGVQYMERGKLDSFTNLAKQYLDRDPNCRELIFLWLRVDGVDVIRKSFGDYKHLVLKGGLTDNEKMRIVKRFQDKDGPRLLISTIQTGSESLSFHDIVGGQKRYSLISPSYDYVRIAQAAGRTNRVGVKSDSQVEYLYGGDILFSKDRKEIYPAERQDQIDFYSNEYAIMQNIKQKEIVTSNALNLEEAKEKIYEKVYGKMKDDDDIKDELKEFKAKYDEEYKKLVSRQLPTVSATFFEPIQYEGEFLNPIVAQLLKQGYQTKEGGAPDELIKRVKLNTVIANEVKKTENEYNKVKDDVSKFEFAAKEVNQRRKG